MLNRAPSLQHVTDFTGRQPELRRMKKVKSITTLKRLQRGAGHTETLAARKPCNFSNFLTVPVIRYCTPVLGGNL
jgi:hypothetical protein